MREGERWVYIFLPFFAGELLVAVEVCGNVDTEEFVGVSNEFVLVGEDECSTYGVDTWLLMSANDAISLLLPSSSSTPSYSPEAQLVVRMLAQSLGCCRILPFTSYCTLESHSMSLGNTLLGRVTLVDSRSNPTSVIVLQYRGPYMFTQYLSFVSINLGMSVGLFMLLLLLLLLFLLVVMLLLSGDSDLIRHTVPPMLSDVQIMPSLLILIGHRRRSFATMRSFYIIILFGWFQPTLEEFPCTLHARHLGCPRLVKTRVRLWCCTTWHR